MTVLEENQFKALEGDWSVERLSGLLPPMLGVRKRIRGDRGETRLGCLPGVPFYVHAREGGVALIYLPPFSMFIDKLWPAPDGSWLGHWTLGNRRLGKFRLVRR